MTRSPELDKKRMITEILEQFDFEKCREAMLALNWGWWCEGTPSLQVMKDSAKKRLEEAIEYVTSKNNDIRADEPVFVSSGGLKATAIKNRYGHLSFLKLEFVVTDWDADGD